MTFNKNMTLRQMANFYNDQAKAHGKTEIKKFSSREVAIHRCTEIAKGTKAIVAMNNTKVRGRPATNAGKKLFPLTKANPRLPGSNGYHSFKIIADNPGIAYEDYLKAGGRNNDLRWDIGHGFTEAR